MNDSLDTKALAGLLSTAIFHFQGLAKILNPPQEVVEMLARLAVDSTAQPQEGATHGNQEEGESHEEDGHQKGSEEEVQVS
jgi:hypothetical protein